MTTLPIFTLGGTGAATLSREYNKVWQSVHQSRRMLVETTCHPRDFSLEDEAWVQAREEREAALNKLLEVEDYLMDLAFHCSCHVSS